MTSDGLREQVYSVLLVSSSDKFNRALLDALPAHRCYPVRVAAGVLAARRELSERNYDIVMINAPLPDDFGTRLAIDVSGELGVGVMLFVRPESYGDVSSSVTEFGVLTVQKPSSSQFVIQSFNLLCATRERIKRMEKKTRSLEEKMEEIRAVNRAKWALIDSEGMSEQEAHRYIEKTAMDRCVTRGAIAKEIIEKYGDRQEK